MTERPDDLLPHAAAREGRQGARRALRGRRTLEHALKPPLDTRATRHRLAHRDHDDIGAPAGWLGRRRCLGIEGGADGHVRSLVGEKRSKLANAAATLGTKPGEIKALFKQTLEADRARELKEQMLAAGLPV